MLWDRVYGIGLCERGRVYGIRFCERVWLGDTVYGIGVWGMVRG